MNSQGILDRELPLILCTKLTFKNDLQYTQAHDATDTNPSSHLQLKVPEDHDGK